MLEYNKTEYFFKFKTNSKGRGTKIEDNNFACAYYLLGMMQKKVRVVWINVLEHNGCCRHCRCRLPGEV